MGCSWLLDMLCELVTVIPLAEFHGMVRARVYRCHTPNGVKCLRVDPEADEYSEEIYEVDC